MIAGERGGRKEFSQHTRQEKPKLFGDVRRLNSRRLLPAVYSDCEGQDLELNAQANKKPLIFILDLYF
jgi:hypothetical protein